MFNEKFEIRKNSFSVSSRLGLVMYFMIYFVRLCFVSFTICFVSYALMNMGFVGCIGFIMACVLLCECLRGSPPTFSLFSFFESFFSVSFIFPACSTIRAYVLYYRRVIEIS